MQLPFAPVVARTFRTQRLTLPEVTRGVLTFFLVLLSFQYALRAPDGRLPTWAEVLRGSLGQTPLERALNASWCGGNPGTQTHSESQSGHNHGAHCPLCLTAAFAENPSAPPSLRVPEAPWVHAARYALPPPQAQGKYAPPIRGPPVT